MEAYMIDKPINDRLLERFLLNELPAEDIKEIEREIHNDPDLKDRLEKLEASNRDILNRYPAKQMADEIRNNVRLEKLKQINQIQSNKRAPQSLMFKRLAFASPALVAIIVFFFILSPFKEHINRIDNPLQTDVTRIKGSELDMSKPNLLIYRNTDGQIETLKDGSGAGTGDLLQLAYTVPEAHYGVIFSIDGNGVVTWHFPDNMKQLVKLEKMKKVLLKNAYELDDAPEFERFFFITSPEPIDGAKLLKEAEEAAKDRENIKKGSVKWGQANMNIPLTQTTLLIRKR
jgi:hypothetical protein